MYFLARFQSAQLYMCMTDEGDDVQVRVWCRSFCPPSRLPLQLRLFLTKSWALWTWGGS